MKFIGKTSGKLTVWLKNWSMPIFIVLFLYLAVILVWVWRSSEQGPELAKFLGYLIGGGLLILQILVSNRRATAAEETAKAMQETAKSTEKGNIAERFKNAIEHLGNDSASVRLGGVYALHHIAQEVDEYRKRIFEILCAHIRETTTHTEYKTKETGSRVIGPTIEIQSILNLLFIETQGQKTYKGLQSNLEGADLQGARCQEANLLNARLWNVNLQNAILWNANLENATLLRANLQNANLWDANLQNANLWDANLQNADLLNANLQNADLLNANLKDSTFYDTNLTDVSNLEINQLLKAKTLYKTKLPDGMKEEIMQKKPELFNDPYAKQEN